MVTITHHDGTQVTLYHGHIPDLWHIAMWLQGHSSHQAIIMDADERARYGRMVLDCWSLCHELYGTLQQLQINNEVKP